MRESHEPRDPETPKDLMARISPGDKVTFRTALLCDGSGREFAIRRHGWAERPGVDGGWVIKMRGAFAAIFGEPCYCLVTEDNVVSVE